MSGWIHVITGPMYSGKTEVLLREVRLHLLRGDNLLLFRPKLDDRTPDVKSRTGVSFPAIAIKDSSEILSELYYSEEYVDSIAIDEAQFLDDDLARVVESLANTDRRIIVSGLDRDFLRRPFGPMERLLTYADEVDKLSAVCFTCKGEATLTQRLIDGRPATPDDPLILVGGMGDDTYEARCREHHEIGA